VINFVLFFLKPQRYIKKITGIILLISLTGCGNDDFSDVNQYISKVKAQTKGAIKPIPEVKEIESFVFNPKGLRDPFKPLAQPEQLDITANQPTGGGIKPDLSRRKEELELLSLEDLKMMGTVEEKSKIAGTPSKIWGLVKSSDGTIHRVQTGNYMGKNYGKILHISVDKIELMEIVPDKPGVWREQQTSLALTE
jgi:type IV pilus assembly protein PilP